MAQASASGEAFDEARRLLALRDAELADADRALAATVAAAHGIAVDSIGRIEAIGSGIESAAESGPTDSAAGARALSRHLVDRNREIADVVTEARDAVHAKTVALKQLAQHYTQR